MFPLESFRVLINRKYFKEKLVKEEKRVYLQERRISDKECDRFTINENALEVEADSNVL